MRKHILMLFVVASFVRFSLTRGIVVALIAAGRRLGFEVDALVLIHRSRLTYWHYVHPLDGYYRFHLERARKGHFECYFRHHSSEETPADVFPSFGLAAVSAVSQIERYLSISEGQAWRQIHDRSPQRSATLSLMS